MRIVTAALFVALTATTTLALDLSTKELSRTHEAATGLKELHGIPDKDIPDDLSGGGPNGSS